MTSAPLYGDVRVSPADLSSAPVSRARGRLRAASWRLIRTDRELRWLPVLATFSALAFGFVVFTVAFLVTWFALSMQAVALAVGAAAAVLSLPVTMAFWQCAAVLGATARAEGRSPELADVLADAWTQYGPALRWTSVVMTRGRGLSSAPSDWVRTSSLGLPVAVLEGLDAGTATRRSASLVTSTWRGGDVVSLRARLLPALLAAPGVLAIAGGVSMLTANRATTPSGSFAEGALLCLLGVVALVHLAMTYASVSAYGRTLAYRHATLRAVPEVDAAVFAAC
jgi:hypothetical protein